MIRDASSAVSELYSASQQVEQTASSYEQALAHFNAVFETASEYLTLDEIVKLVKPALWHTRHYVS